MSGMHRIFVVLMVCVAGMPLMNCGGGGGGSAPIINALPGPQNLKAVPGAQKVMLTWDPVTSATQYKVYYSASSPITTTSGTLASAVSSTGYTHSGRSVGTYHYIVTAVVTSIESAASTAASAGVALMSFTTSTSGFGDLSTWPDAVSAGSVTGLVAADAVCQARAQAAGFTGTFRAWLSDDNNDAYCRITGYGGKKAANCNQVALPTTAGPWVRPDGLPFADEITTLISSGTLLTPAHLDENGSTAGRFWNNTDGNGVATAATCVSWTTSSNAVAGMFGEDVMTVNALAGGSSTGCGWSGRLICMQTGAGVPLTYQTVGRKVFQTSTSGGGDLGLWTGATGTGLSAGDAICNARAAAASLTGTYKAWLSDSTTDAASRIMSDGPWIRIDGVKLADTKADLIDGELLTTITLDEFKNVTSASAWTGSATTGTKTATTCSDWTSNNNGVSGDISYTNIINYWSGWIPQACDKTFFSLYCFED